MSELSNLDYDSFTFSSMSDLSDISDMSDYESGLSDTDISHMDISDTHTNKLIGGMETQDDQAKKAKFKANIQINKAKKKIIDGTETTSKHQTNLESSIKELDEALKSLRDFSDATASDDSITDEEQLTKDMIPYTIKISKELVSVTRNTKLLEMFNLINEVMIEAEKYINDKSTYEEDAQTKIKELEELKEKYEILKKQLVVLDTLPDKDLPEEEKKIRKEVDDVKDKIKLVKELVEKETLVTEKKELTRIIENYKKLKEDVEEAIIEGDAFETRHEGKKHNVKTYLLKSSFNKLKKEVEGEEKVEEQATDDAAAKEKEGEAEGEAEGEEEDEDTFGKDLEVKSISLKKKNSIEKQMETVETDMQILLISIKNQEAELASSPLPPKKSKKPSPLEPSRLAKEQSKPVPTVEIDQGEEGEEGEEILDSLMFQTLELFNDRIKESGAGNPIIKEKEELLKCLNDYKLELDYRSKLVKQDRTNKEQEEQEESDIEKYITKKSSSMLTDITNIYYGVRNKYRDRSGKYNVPNYESFTLKYTVLLCTNSNYYDTIGLLAISYINEDDYKKKKSESLNKYKEYIDSVLYKHEHKFYTASRANIVSVYEERELDIQIITIKDYKDS